MLIALLAVLGVDLIVIVVLLAVALSRKRWVNHQPGAFRGAIRIADGDIDGLHPKWRRGYGRWVRDVLIWTKAPFLFRNEVLAADGLDELRHAASDEVKRLGDDPVVVRIRIGSAEVELAAHESDAKLALGPFSATGESAAVDQPSARSASTAARTDG
jgi:hypothetical protein